MWWCVGTLAFSLQKCDFPPNFSHSNWCASWDKASTPHMVCYSHFIFYSVALASSCVVGGSIPTLAAVAARTYSLFLSSIAASAYIAWGEAHASSASATNRFGSHLSR